MNNICRSIAILLSFVLFLPLTIGIASTEYSENMLSDTILIATAKESLRDEYGIDNDRLNESRDSVYHPSDDAPAWRQGLAIVYIDPSRDSDRYEITYRIGIAVAPGDNLGDILFTQVEGVVFWNVIAPELVSRGKLKPLLDNLGDSSFQNLMPSVQATYIELLIENFPFASIQRTYRSAGNSVSVQNAEASKEMQLERAKRFLMDSFDFPQDAFALYDASVTILYRRDIRGKHVYCVEFVPNFHRYQLASHVVEICIDDESIVAYRAYEGWRIDTLDSLITIIDSATQMGAEKGIRGLWSPEGYTAYKALWKNAGILSTSYPRHFTESPNESRPFNVDILLPIAIDAIVETYGCDEEEVDRLWLFSAAIYNDDPNHPVWGLEVFGGHEEPDGSFLEIMYTVFIAPETNEVLLVINNA